MTTERRLDDCLTAREGRLFVEACNAVELVRRFGSPLFVVSEDQIRRNVRAFQESFAAGWPHGPVAVLPAAKANWALAVQRVLADAGCGCDVYSAGELRVALESGFDPARVSLNGVPKEPGSVRRAVAAGARITVDSLEEIEMIEAAARETGRTARVRLRVKPVLSGFVDHSDFVAEGLVPTDIAALAYKGGLAFEDAVAAGRRLQAAAGVEIVGFHQHHGRHHPSTRYWEEQMRAFAREVGRVSAALGGLRPRELDIGGGFAIPRDPHNAATDYTAPAQLALLHGLSKGLHRLGERVRYGALRRLVSRMAGRPNPNPAPTIAEYARACTATLSAELPRHGIDPRGIELQLEPGRAIHGNAGVHLATVKSVKRVRHPIPWTTVIVDTTEFWMTGGRLEHHLHHHLVASRMDAPAAMRADVIGRSCYGDRLLPAVDLPALEPGDVFAFLDTGAYQEVSCSNFNAMPRPALVMVTGGRAEVIREAEADDDVFRRDRVPAHLRGGAPEARAAG